MWLHRSKSWVHTRKYCSWRIPSWSYIIYCEVTWSLTNPQIHLIIFCVVALTGQIDSSTSDFILEGSSVGRALVFAPQGHGLDPGHHQLSVWVAWLGCGKLCGGKYWELMADVALHLSSPSSRGLAIALLIPSIESRGLADTDLLTFNTVISVRSAEDIYTYNMSSL